MARFNLTLTGLFCICTIQPNSHTKLYGPSKHQQLAGVMFSTAYMQKKNCMFPKLAPLGSNKTCKTNIECSEI